MWGKRFVACIFAHSLGIAVAVVGTLSGLPEAQAGPAVGQLEIKSLGMVPGRIELQSQNAFSFGNPRRAIRDENGEIETDDNSIASVRAALEVEYTFNRFFKTRVGIEYEKERLEDVLTIASANSFDRLRLDEYEVEGIVVLVPRPTSGLAVGLLFEYEYPAERKAAQTLNYGPIIEWVSGPVLATFNPSLVSYFGGETNEAGKRDDKIDFRYAARVMYQTTHDLALAVEAFGTVERIGSTGNPGKETLLFGDFNQHRLGPVVYWSFAAGEEFAGGEQVEATIGLGAFAGLNRSTPAATLKLSLEVEF